MDKNETGHEGDQRGDHRIDEKVDEVSVVPMADAAAGDDTVVISLQHTNAADLAMTGSRWSPDSALVALVPVLVVPSPLQ